MIRSTTPVPSTGGPEVATGWRRGLPIVDVLRTYERSWIVKDLTAGTVLVALLAPAGTRRVRVAVHVGVGVTGFERRVVS